MVELRIQSSIDFSNKVVIFKSVVRHLFYQFYNLKLGFIHFLELTKPNMVMHRALFTWFILLVFFILLCLRLEARTHWNWFLIFLPLWIYDFILLIDALFHIIISCIHHRLKDLLRDKNMLSLLIVISLVTGQIMLCLKLEYGLLDLVHVLIPFWVLLSLLIFGISMSLFVTQY